MAGQPTDITITSQRGGLNDTTPKVALQADECTLAENAEFFESMCGERRNGSTLVSITNSGLITPSASTTPVIGTHIHEWYPTNDVTDPEWWGITTLFNGGEPYSMRIAKRSRPTIGGVWTAVTPFDPISMELKNAFGMLELYDIKTQQCNSRLQSLDFWAYPSQADRMHVYDGSVLRRAGQAPPLDAPAVAGVGAGSTYVGTRYFRVRFIVEDPTAAILRRSEPSTATTLAAGIYDSATITRPALTLPYEGETHWEVEASVNDADYYRIAVVPIATTTYSDTTLNGLTYPDVGPLSEDIGDYLLLPAAQFVAVDGDRLLLGGHQYDAARRSSVYWTLDIDAPGVGNNERLPLSVNNTLNLDNGAGGPVTGISAGVDGVWYAFKWQRIYQMVRTNNAQIAYQPITLSHSRGAVPGSIFGGVDEKGRSCVYFLDPYLGPSRVGVNGIDHLDGVRNTWKRVNRKARTAIAHGVSYESKQQVHWWVAVDGSNTVSMKLVLQTSETHQTESGNWHGCWSTVPAADIMAHMYCSAILTETVIENGVTTISRRPYGGYLAFDGGVTSVFHRCDVGDVDGDTIANGGYGLAYTAHITSRPWVPNGIIGKWGTMEGNVLAMANSSRTAKIKLTRDFGKETSTPITMTLTPDGTETEVIVEIDDLRLSDARALQVEITD